ncbi:MAG TPA: putative Ig domain-containing protein, partial [Candidatus Aquilonibacter sp.]|nr:putative Ig domain-containing protein [Candidatus Aquilonibacter sp.]
MKSAAKLAALGIGLGLAAAGCGTGTVVVALVSPTISQVSPQVVTAGTPSVTVTVQGQNFQSSSALTLNGSAMPTTVVNSTTLSAQISGSPLAQPAVAHLQVKNSDGAASNEVPLTVTNPSQTSTLAISTSGLPGAQSGTGYSAALSASGGTPGYTWSISSGTLPAGLTLSSGGAISGTPTASGTSTFAVTVSDSSSPAQTQTVTLSIVVLPATQAPATLTIGSGTLAAGQVGSAYNAALSAAGGTPSYTWSLASGSLPAGLSLSSAGVISGTPTASGTSTFNVTVKDSGSPAQSASGQVSISVASTSLAVHSVSLGAGVVGSSYSTTLTATGGTPGYTWSLASGSLPAGLTLSSSGIISGTPTGTGTATFTVTVADSGTPQQTASSQESLTISPSTLTITSTSLSSGKEGSSYSTTLTATGGTPGYTWSVASGSLPAGLTLSNAGVISGTPTGSGTATFTVAVMDSGLPAQTTTTQESIAIASSQLTITSTLLAQGTNGSAYSSSLAASGGAQAYTWTVSSGSLPAGLTLSSAGVISGTPTASGSASFTVTVTDSSSPMQTASAQESIIINAASSGSSSSGTVQLYLYPASPVAPAGSYQTITAIVNGVSDQTVTWTSDGGTIVGTNPCVANEPCTVALYSANPGTYTVTATSDANAAVMAMSTVTFTNSPTPVTDHPRFLMTSAMLPGLRAKATA